MRRQKPACIQKSTTDGEWPSQEPIGLHAEIRLKGQTHRRETVTEILVAVDGRNRLPVLNEMAQRSRRPMRIVSQAELLSR